MNYWIGLNDRQKEGVWVYSDGSRIQGFNGSRMQGFDGWFPGQPKNAQRTQHCVNMWMLKNLLWVDDDCGIRYLYICQFEARNCSANATRFEAYCLELSREFVTYDEADHACIARGGILAAVKTRAMHELLKTMIYSERWWKNISEQDVTHINRKHRYSFARSWIGIRYVQREWVYSDGTFVNPNFTKWAIGEPYDPEEGEDCVMSSQDWYDDLCNNVRPFICQYDRISRQVLPPVSPVYRATTKTPEPEAVVEKLVDEYTGIRLGPFEFAFLIFGCFVLGVVCSMLVFYKSRFLSNPRRRMKDDGQDMAILENEVTYPTQDDR